MTHDRLGIVGKTIGDKYLVEAAVGEGSFAYVYRALHLVWRQPVAIKCFKGMSDVSPDARRQLLADFVQEGALLSELSGRSATIVQARDAGVLTGSQGEELPYIVLEWLEGRTLDSILMDQRAIFGAMGWPFGKAQALIEPLAAALAMVHRRGIAHRDIKPENVWVGGPIDGEERFVKLLDFGIAKVVRDVQRREFQKTGGAITSFTPGYGAPEQFTRQLGGTGPWTDVYALALVFTEILAGRPALEGDDFVQLGMAAVDPERRPTPRRLGIELGDPLEAVFARALAVKPDDRFATADEFWRALEEAEKSGSRMSTAPPVQATALSLRAPSTSETTADAVRRRRMQSLFKKTLLAGSLGALLVLGVHARFDIRFASLVRSLSARAQVAMGAGSHPTTTTLPVDHAVPSAVAAPAAPMPKAATPAALRTPCPQEMALVEGGTFTMGADDAEASLNEKPPHQVKLSPFCIDRKEVTVGSYKLCAAAGQCERAPFEVEWQGITRHQRKTFSQACNGDDPEKSQQPVNCVSWNMAAQYCAFADKRLPTEAEWELAARGVDGRLYPWGDDPPDATRANACGNECSAWGEKNGAAMAPLYKADDGYPLTAPVGSFPAGRSPYGLFDMVGNVWEWVGDWDGAYSGDAQVDPSGARTGIRRVLRGGAFTGAANTWLRATRRYSDFADTRSHAYGFRCARTSEATR